MQITGCFGELMSQLSRKAGKLVDRLLADKKIKLSGCSMSTNEVLALHI